MGLGVDISAVASVALGGAAASIPMALAAGWFAWAFKRGRMRQMAGKYRDPNYPWYVRNAVFTIGPAAGFFGAASLAFLMLLSGNLLMIAGTLLVFSSMGIAVLLVALWGRHPPDFLKPQWLLEDDQRLGRPPMSNGPYRVLGAIAFGALMLCAGIAAIGPFLLVITSALQAGH